MDGVSVLSAEVCHIFARTNSTVGLPEIAALAVPMVCQSSGLLRLPVVEYSNSRNLPCAWSVSSHPLHLALMSIPVIGFVKIGFK